MVSAEAREEQDWARSEGVGMEGAPSIRAGDRPPAGALVPVRRPAGVVAAEGRFGGGEPLVCVVAGGEDAAGAMGAIQGPSLPDERDETVCHSRRVEGLASPAVPIFIVQI